jgi:hypothetical protein
MAWREIIAPKDESAKPLFKPLSELSFDEFFKAEDEDPPRMRI